MQRPAPFESAGPPVTITSAGVSGDTGIQAYFDATLTDITTIVGFITDQDGDHTITSWTVFEGTLRAEVTDPMNNVLSFTLDVGTLLTFDNGGVVDLPTTFYF